MKNLFYGFYRLSNEGYQDLWKNGLFALDSSFLCSLYRLPETACKELMGVLSKLCGRIWVPYHAALEFHRNRPTVLADQKRKFGEVAEIIDKQQKEFRSALVNLGLKKRHSLIDPDSLEKRVDDLFAGFKRELSELESNLPSLSDHDTLLGQLQELLKEKIGAPPESQDAVDEICVEGQTRYKKRIPPGYMDISKGDTKEGAFFQHGGIVYERQYGDLLIWKQLLAHAKSNQLHSVALLVDDLKEDWWWYVGKSSRVGPRPELREEINSQAGVERFHLYTSEQFLRMSRKYLEVEVSEESIEAAKDLQSIIEESRLYFGVSRKSSPYKIVEDLVWSLASDLVNANDEVTSAIAETNAYGFGLDTYDILKVQQDKKSSKIRFSADIQLSGDSHEDKPWCGDEICVEVSGTIGQTPNGWEIESYEVESCETNFR